MPTILSDPPQWLWIALALAFVLPLGVAFFFFGGPASPKDAKQKRSSKNTCFVVSGIALVLLLGLFACGRLVESDRKQIDRKLHEMSDGVRERNLNKVFQHVSESFRYGSATKAQLRQLGERAQQAGQVDEIPIWDLNVDPIATGENKATVVFRFRVNGNVLRENQFLCRAQFVRDSDRQWRLQGFEVFPPTGLKDAYPIPGLQ